MPSDSEMKKLVQMTPEFYKDFIRLKIFERDLRTNGSWSDDISAVAPLLLVNMPEWPKDSQLHLTDFMRDGAQNYAYGNSNASTVYEIGRFHQPATGQADYHGIRRTPDGRPEVLEVPRDGDRFFASVLAALGEDRHRRLGIPATDKADQIAHLRGMLANHLIAHGADYAAALPEGATSADEDFSAANGIHIGDAFFVEEPSTSRDVFDLIDRYGFVAVPLILDEMSGMAPAQASPRFLSEDAVRRIEAVAAVREDFVGEGDPVPAMLAERLTSRLPAQSFGAVYDELSSSKGREALERYRDERGDDETNDWTVEGNDLFQLAQQQLEDWGLPAIEPLRVRNVVEGAVAGLYALDATGFSPAVVLPPAFHVPDMGHAKPEPHSAEQRIDDAFAQAGMARADQLNAPMQAGVGPNPAVLRRAAPVVSAGAYADEIIPLVDLTGEPSAQATTYRFISPNEVAVAGGILREFFRGPRGRAARYSAAAALLGAGIYGLKTAADYFWPASAPGRGDTPPVDAATSQQAAEPGDDSNTPPDDPVDSLDLTEADRTFFKELGHISAGPEYGNRTVREVVEDLVRESGDGAFEQVRHLFQRPQLHGVVEELAGDAGEVSPTVAPGRASDDLSQHRLAVRGIALPGHLREKRSAQAVQQTQPEPGEADLRAILDYAKKQNGTINQNTARFSLAPTSPLRADLEGGQRLLKRLELDITFLIIKGYSRKDYVSGSLRVHQSGEVWGTYRLAGGTIEKLLFDPYSPKGASLQRRRQIAALTEYAVRLGGWLELNPRVRLSTLLRANKIKEKQNEIPVNTLVELLKKRVPDSSSNHEEAAEKANDALGQKMEGWAVDRGYAWEEIGPDLWRDQFDDTFVLFNGRWFPCTTDRHGDIRIRAPRGAAYILLERDSSGWSVKQQHFPVTTARTDTATMAVPTTPATPSAGNTVGSSVSVAAIASQSSRDNVDESRTTIRDQATDHAARVAVDVAEAELRANGTQHASAMGQAAFRLQGAASPGASPTEETVANITEHAKDGHLIGSDDSPDGAVGDEIDGGAEDATTAHLRVRNARPQVFASLAELDATLANFKPAAKGYEELSNIEKFIDDLPPGSESGWSARNASSHMLSGSSPVYGNGKLDPIVNTLRTLVSSNKWLTDRCNAKQYDPSALWLYAEADELKISIRHIRTNAYRPFFSVLMRDDGFNVRIVEEELKPAEHDERTSLFDYLNREIAQPFSEDWRHHLAGMSCSSSGRCSIETALKAYDLPTAPLQAIRSLLAQAKQLREADWLSYNDVSKQRNLLTELATSVDLHSSDSLGKPAAQVAIEVRQHVENSPQYSRYEQETSATVEDALEALAPALVVSNIPDDVAYCESASWFELEQAVHIASAVYGIRPGDFPYADLMALRERHLSFLDDQEKEFYDQETALHSSIEIAIKLGFVQRKPYDQYTPEALEKLVAEVADILEDKAPDRVEMAVDELRQMVGEPLTEQQIFRYFNQKPEPKGLFVAPKSSQPRTTPPPDALPPGLLSPDTLLANITPKYYAAFDKFSGHREIYVEKIMEKFLDAIPADQRDILVGGDVTFYSPSWKYLPNIASRDAFNKQTSYPGNFGGVVLVKKDGRSWLFELFPVDLSYSVSEIQNDSVTLELSQSSGGYRRSLYYRDLEGRLSSPGTFDHVNYVGKDTGPGLGFADDIKEMGVISRDENNKKTFGVMFAKKILSSRETIRRNESNFHGTLKEKKVRHFTEKQERKTVGDTFVNIAKNSLPFVECFFVTDAASAAGCAADAIPLMGKIARLPRTIKPVLKAANSVFDAGVGLVISGGGKRLLLMRGFTKNDANAVLSLWRAQSGGGVRVGAQDGAAWRAADGATVPSASGKPLKAELVPPCRVRRQVAMAGTCSSGQPRYRAITPDDALGLPAANPRDRASITVGQRISPPEGFSENKNFAPWFGESYSTVSEVGGKNCVVLRGQRWSLPRTALDSATPENPVIYKDRFQFEVMAQQGIFFHGRAKMAVEGFSGELQVGLVTAPSTIQAGSYSGRHFGVMALEELRPDGRVGLKYYYGSQVSPLGQRQPTMLMQASLGSDGQSQDIMRELRTLHRGSLHANNLAIAYGSDNLNKALGNMRLRIVEQPNVRGFRYIRTDTDAAEMATFVVIPPRAVRRNGLEIFENLLSEFVKPRSNVRYVNTNYRNIN